MDNSSYTTLARQSGLMKEMQVVANNIANAATTGYRAEGLIFSEFVQAVDNGPSISMATANTRQTSMEQGALTQTENQFDFAIEGDGFFLVQTPAGERVTRSGSFAMSAAGDLVTHDGYPVLDPGGAPIFIPPDVAEFATAPDGTLSGDGRLLGQIGIMRPIDENTLRREDGVMFSAESGFEIDDTSRVVQGFIENSNVNPVVQIARMIEVQRAYEMGQSFLETESERVRSAIETLIRRG